MKPFPTDLPGAYEDARLALLALGSEVNDRLLAAPDPRQQLAMAICHAALEDMYTRLQEGEGDPHLDHWLMDAWEALQTNMENDG